MTPSVYSRATDEDKPLFGTMGDLLASWDSKCDEFLGMNTPDMESKRHESGEWRNWIAREVKDFDAASMEIASTLDGGKEEADELTTRNQVLSGLNIDAPTPELPQVSAHRRENAEAETASDESEQEQKPDQHDASTVLEEEIVKSKGKERRIPSPPPEPLRFRLRRHERPLRSTKLDASVADLVTPRTTSMNDRFPMLMGAKLDVGKGSRTLKRVQPVLKTSVAAGPSGYGTRPVHFNETELKRHVSAEEVESRTNLSLETLESDSERAIQAVATVNVEIKTTPVRDMENRGPSMRWNHILKSQRQSNSLATLGAISGISSSTYFTARGSPSSSSPRTINTIIAANTNPSPRSLSRYQNNSNEHTGDWPSTVKSVKASPSMASLEADLTVKDILRGPHRDGVTEDISILAKKTYSEDKENTSPARCEKHSANSPGKRMAEKWLAERRSETMLNARRFENHGLDVERVGSALEIRNGLFL
jgi:hypothetical protein